MTTDPIADLLTRIRNAAAVRKPLVVVPYSRLKLEIAQLLQADGYIKEAVISPVKDSSFQEIKITLKYASNGASVIQGLQRVSRPGQRIYTPVNRLIRVLGGVGTAVVSTSQGVMTDTQARTVNLGGEVLFKIW